ncbi:MAG: DUF3365 domain-containing protein [Deferribacterales bacterium]
MKRYSFLILALIFLAFLCSYELYQGFVHFRTTTLNKARDIADVTLAFRRWNSSAGEVFASRDHIQPNPYLDPDHRDLKVDGKELTRINPAYMTRLVSEILSEDGNIHMRMISDEPMNNINLPQPWELEGLKYIKQNNPEFSKVDYKDIDNIMFYYVRPVFVDQSCMQCHGYQGYKIGDVRGGLSVSFPVTDLHHKVFSVTVMTVVTYLLSAGLVLFTIISSRKKLIDAYQQKLENISALKTEIERREMSEKALITRTRSSSVTEILRLIAHHWRQPLNNVGLLIQSMKEESGSKDIEESADSAMEIIHEMSDTINLFTSTVRAESKKRLEIKDKVFDVLKLLKPELENSGIEVHIKCTLGGSMYKSQFTDDDMIFHSCGHGNMVCDRSCGLGDIYIYGEESVFKQILLILLKNSYDALMEIKDKKDRRMDIVFEKSGEYSLIHICDNGAPITEEIKQKLFDPYFSTKGYDAGRGIGLFTARSLVENFNDAHVYYDDSEGKCFIFKFRTA